VRGGTKHTRSAKRRHDAVVLLCFVHSVDLAGVVKAMERVMGEAVRQLAPSTSLPAGLEVRGAEPSPIQAIEMVQDMW